MNVVVHVKRFVSCLLLRLVRLVCVRLRCMRLHVDLHLLAAWLVVICLDLRLSLSLVLILIGSGLVVLGMNEVRLLLLLLLLLSELLLLRLLRLRLSLVVLLGGRLLQVVVFVSLLLVSLEVRVVLVWVWVLLRWLRCLHRLLGLSLDRRLRMKVSVDEILILASVVRVKVMLQLLLLLVDAGEWLVRHQRRTVAGLLVSVASELVLVVGQLARVQVRRVLGEHQLVLRGRLARRRRVRELLVLRGAHGRAGLLGMARQVIFAAEARVARRADVLAKTQVRVLVASEIFGREELFIALGAAELAVLRWP